MHTQHRPLTSAITKMLLEVAVKIHLDVNHHYFPRQVSRSKEGLFLRAGFIRTSGRRRREACSLLSERRWG